MTIRLVRRRDFVALLGGAAAAWPLAAHAQQPAVPLVGVLRSTPAAPFAHLIDALRQGLKDEGLTEGRNFVIEERWADNHRDRLSAMAVDSGRSPGRCDRDPRDRGGLRQGRDHNDTDSIRGRG